MASRKTTRNNKKKQTEKILNDNPKWSGGHDGTHDPTDVPGIIGFLGPGTKSRKEIKVQLWDMAPTILKLTNVPIPKDMDGTPIRITESREKQSNSKVELISHRVGKTLSHRPDDLPPSLQ